MKHAASRELYAYWEERRGQRPAPERTDIEPGAIRQALSDTFILELDAADGHSSCLDPPRRREEGVARGDCHHAAGRRFDSDRR